MLQVVRLSWNAPFYTVSVFGLRPPCQGSLTRTALRPANGRRHLIRSQKIVVVDGQLANTAMQDSYKKLSSPVRERLSLVLCNYRTYRKIKLSTLMHVARIRLREISQIRSHNSLGTFPLYTHSISPRQFPSLCCFALWQEVSDNSFTLKIYSHSYSFFTCRTRGHTITPLEHHLHRDRWDHS